MKTAGLIAKKLGMTQVFSPEGYAMPVTIFEVEPSVVVQKKTKGTDGYDALQLGYGRVKAKRVSKPLQGHMQKAGKGLFRVLKEFPVFGDYEIGSEISVEIFATGDFVDVTAISKGKGFAGVVKRHGFAGGRASHGSMFHRAPGSIGASSEPSRVWKGQRFPGHMGAEQCTVQNLTVVAIKADRNLMIVKGAVPGVRNAVVVISKARKKEKKG